MGLPRGSTLAAPPPGPSTPRQNQKMRIIRTTTETNDLLRQAAGRAHRSLAPMIEGRGWGYTNKARLQASAVPAKAAEG